MRMGDVGSGRGPCFVCKHPLVDPRNIFKTRTAFSKTLISSKLSKLVQTVFRQETPDHVQEICASCSELVNQVDECEIKLMALENEVKLKYKMPFPIEVHSRRSEDEGDVGKEEVVDQAAVDEAVAAASAAAAAGTEQFSLIGIDGTAIQASNGSTIVLQTQDVDGKGLMVYRGGSGHVQQYDPAVQYLAELGTGGGDQHHQETAAMIQLQTSGAGDVIEEVSALDDEDDPLSGMVDVVAQEIDDEEEVDLIQAAANSEAIKSGSMARIFFCSDCDEAFVSLPHLRRHRLQHGEGKAFPCRFCQRTFATNIALHNHWNIEHPTELKPCPYCNKRFINRSNLNQHISTHKEPTFKCEFCSRQFRSKGDMRKHHVFRHSTAKEHQCAECSMSFKVNWLLTRHRLRVHGH